MTLCSRHQKIRDDFDDQYYEKIQTRGGFLALHAGRPGPFEDYEPDWAGYRRARLEWTMTPGTGNGYPVFRVQAKLPLPGRDTAERERTLERWLDPETVSYGGLWNRAEGGQLFLLCAFPQARRDWIEHGSVLLNLTFNAAPSHH